MFHDVVADVFSSVIVAHVSIHRTQPGTLEGFAYGAWNTALFLRHSVSECVGRVMLQTLAMLRVHKQNALLMLQTLAMLSSQAGGGGEFVIEVRM